MSNLFKAESFVSHSGLDLNWKIECDALSDPEWFTISQMIMEVSPPFREAYGIPRGGSILAVLLSHKLEKTYYFVYSLKTFRAAHCASFSRNIFAL